MKDLWSIVRLERDMGAPLLAAALVRLSLTVAGYAATGTRVMTQGDTASYLEPGLNLLWHGIFASGGQPEIDRTPGYPLFAIATGMAFGNVLLTVVAQIVISLASMLVLRRIADYVYPNRAIGRRAAWIYAFEPLSIVLTVRVMPETLFVFFLLLAIERVLAFQAALRLRYLALGGVLLAAATYVRPVAFYLCFLLAAGLAMAMKPSPMRWKAPAVLLLSCLPWLAVWQLRNASETGYTGFSSIVETNLYFFQSAEITADLQHISIEAEQKKLGYLDDDAYFAMHPEQRAWPRFERLRFMRARSTQILARHPLLYLKSHFKGVLIVAVSPCATEWLQMLGLYPNPESMPRRILNEGVAASVKRIVLAHPGVMLAMAVFEAFLLTIYGLAVRGLLRTPRVHLAAMMLLGVAAYFLFIAGGAQAVGRYRAPVMPILCLFAAAGIPVSRAKEMRGHGGPA